MIPIFMIKSLSIVLTLIARTLRRKYYPVYIREWRSIINELSEYFKLPKEEVRLRMKHGRRLAREEWLKRNPKTHQEILDFYSEAKNYIFDIAQGDYSLKTIIFREQIAKMCKGKVLDYGGGIGDMIIRASKYSKDLTYYDIPEKCLNLQSGVLSEEI